MTLLAPQRPGRSSRTAGRFWPLAVVEALATPHGIDRYLELVHPMLTVRDLRAEVTDVRRSTEDTVTLTLRPTRQWKGFEAGQFVRVSIDIDGVRRTRCYSPACSQHRADGRVELTIKAHPDGLVSRHLHAHAAPGLVVGLSQADGAFTLPSPRPERALLISGGSGITPVLSMLRTLLDERHTGEVVFLHYAFGERDVAHLDELRSIAAAHHNVRLVLAFTGQAESADGAGGDLHGRFRAQHLKAAAPWYREAETFVCGPLGLTTAIRAHYTDAKLDDRLHTEEFTPTPIVPAGGDAAGELTFNSTGTSAANDGTPILEQAEAAGLAPEHGCRMGICFSCTAVKTSGCTRNVLTGELNSDPDTEIQVCVSAPVGDVAIDL